MTHLLGLVPSLVAATQKKSSSSAGFLLVLVVIVFAGYFLFLRPQQQKQRRAREQTTSIEVGDEILTVGGIVGRVIDMTDDRITILTGEGPDGAEGQPTRLLLVRQAIARKIEPVVVPDEADDDWGKSPEEHHNDDGESSSGEGKSK
jgi:preprotein translocase YajC subunit